MSLDYQTLPKGLQDGMKRYIEHGIEPGSFMTSVMENDLFTAFGRADEMNRYYLYDICKWIYNEAPYSCWGSKEAVKGWIEKGGLGGLDNEV